MKFFKNSELISLYNVSDKAVRNWIESARQGKIDLELFEDSGKYHVADTLQNSVILESLVDQGRKYRNKRSHRKLKPKPTFYETYNRCQILDLVNQLDIHRELPIKYKYFGGGAEYWDEYLNKLYNAGIGNLLTNTIEALSLSLEYLGSLTKNYKNINIVNICVGNSLATEEITRHFLGNSKLRRFITIDLSQSMLDLSEKNIKRWLSKDIKVEKYVRDLDYDNFSDILTQDSFDDDASDTTNIILFLAGPIVNFREPLQVLKVIRESMSKEDILITTLKRDTIQARRFFDFNIQSDKNLLNYHSRHLLELLNIEESFYEVEQSFDESKMLRSVHIQLKLDLSIGFDVENYSKIINLKKGQKIQLFRSWHHSDKNIVDRFDSADFKLLQITKSLDDQLILLAVKRKSYEANLNQ